MIKTRITYRNWNIEVDKKLTQQEYSDIDKPSAESCGCENCLNYIENRSNIFPNEVKELFKELGADFNKEIEISHMARLENGLHYYSGWFHFIGNFKGKDCSIPLPSGGSTIELTQLTNNFGIGFTNAKTLSVFKTDEDLVQIEFDCKIPWTIEKELEPE
jgi:hypothetical protein